MSIEDVLEVYPHLSEEEGRQVLELIVEWDMGGMSCELITVAFEELFGANAPAGQGHRKPVLTVMLPDED